MAGDTDRGEPTQNGNPHQLTKKQHVLPKASIERFADSDGFVKCCFVEDGSIKRLRPSAEVFCASRVWDQRSEAGADTKRIETAFQTLARSIESGQLQTLDASAYQVATSFFALIVEREHVRRERPAAVSLPGRTGHNLSLDERERYEAMGVIVPENDGSIGSRAAAGIRIMGRGLWAKRSDWANWRWGIIRSLDVEFIVPDVIGPQKCIPISPKLLLAAENDDCETSGHGVDEYNRVARAEAERYYFAKRLDS